MMDMEKTNLLFDLVDGATTLKAKEVNIVADLLFDYFGNDDAEYLENVVNAMLVIDFLHTKDHALEDYAYMTMHELYDIPDNLEFYIDYGKFANDLVLGGDIAVLENNEVVIILDNHAF